MVSGSTASMTECHDAIASVSTAPVLLAVAALLLLCWTLLLPLKIPDEVILTFDGNNFSFLLSEAMSETDLKDKILDEGRPGE